ncbi:AAA family ATPase [Bradyrhizobium sp. 83012]|uniref:AAA family ATPase n=1 Tax=Bradyrhizobium aeschynomenes TaxID=2734909 RepID=A0ABX2C8X4_9BRAD|nr:AAA family ATPase [Bradyrhizobium aeschynomenes]NPU64716.1 AAA family ATPase [Bradyrhizobium aeschynomenes]
MLWLKRLEVEGFGPFAETQTIEFPSSPGVTVVYGENMRGKTTLLNAIRYAFFGTVLGRGSRERRLHTITNRARAAQGQYGFIVTLFFEFDGQEYELVRECVPNVPIPISDEHYDQRVMLRRGAAMLGPDQREKTLHLVFPREISRFFLFDGELLQEYEELLINESEAGHRISEAIERILGLPILRRGRTHLAQLSDEADRQAARDASRRQETQQLGVALQIATEQKDAHLKEVARLQVECEMLNAEKAELERYFQSTQKYAAILQQREEASNRLDIAAQDLKQAKSDLQRSMVESWRSLLQGPVQTARAAAQEEVNREVSDFLLSLRRKAANTGHCDTCDQDVAPDVVLRLRVSLPKDPEAARSPEGGVSRAMTRMADLNKFRVQDNVGEVRLLSNRIRDLQIEQIGLRDQIVELDAALTNSDPDRLRKSRVSLAEVIEKLSAARRGIEEENKKVEEKDRNIQRLQRKLQADGGLDLRDGQLRARILRSSAAVFGKAVEKYKSELRQRVETTASGFFLSMTTEKEDYDGLTINEGYGLTIRHKDGRAEEARSAGAEHVVALALMGALQNNAPLRGPIVMDSPFGRLDEGHTTNVIKTLPDMAEQAVLLVYESEVGRKSMRELLGSRLLREYELKRISSRRTLITQVR